MIVSHSVIYRTFSVNLFFFRHSYQDRAKMIGRQIVQYYYWENISLYHQKKKYTIRCILYDFENSIMQSDVDQLQINFITARNVQEFNVSPHILTNSFLMHTSCPKYFGIYCWWSKYVETVHLERWTKKKKTFMWIIVKDLCKHSQISIFAFTDIYTWLFSLWNVWWRITNSDMRAMGKHG